MEKLNYFILRNRSAEKRWVMRSILNWQKALWLFIFAIGTSAHINAADLNETHFTATWNKAGGYVELQFRFWEDNSEDSFFKNSKCFVGDTELFNFGFTNKGYCHDSIECVQKGQINLDIKETQRIESSGYYTGYNSNGKYSYAVFKVRWYPKESELGKKHTFKMTGYITDLGSGGGDDGGVDTKDFSWTKEVTTEYGISKVNISDVTFAEVDGTPYLKVKWTRDSNTESLDKDVFLQLEGPKGKIVKTDKIVNQKSGDIYVKVDKEGSLIDLSKDNNIKISAVYKPNDKLSTSVQGNDYLLYSYPHVTQFESSFDENKRILSLNFNTSGASTNFFKTTYDVYHNDLLLTQIDAINSSTYKKEIEIPENESGEYRLRIVRSLTKGLESWCKMFEQKDEKGSVAFNTNHYKVTNLMAEDMSSEGDPKALVSWDTEGVVWSLNTKCILTRINLTNGATSEINLLKDDFLKKKYEDQMIQLCNSYNYQLQIIPREDTYAAQNAIMTKDHILPVEMGRMEQFTISKGYFSDRTELTWTSKGSFDKYSIERKEAGTTDSEYKQILSIDGSAVMNEYNTEDRTGIAGIVYEYRITGLIYCGKDVKASNKLVDVGFRTPTGDLYGRVTFENGQSVKNVEVYLEKDGSSLGQSVNIENGGKLQIGNGKLLSSLDDSPKNGYTLQAWIAPNNLEDNSVLFSKEGQFKIGIRNGLLYVEAGEKIQSKQRLSNLADNGHYIHVSVSVDTDSIGIYLNGKRDVKSKNANASFSTSLIELGSSYKGLIDEVRLWSKVLDDSDIKSNYCRYLIGNEASLEAYYTFNYAYNGHFYDTSYKGNKYNENHGTTIGAVTESYDIPSNDQLGYRSITRADGSYAIRAIPYEGNGTAYTIIPRMGIHQFESQKEVRFLNAFAQSHTVNFTDKSAFMVEGFITYKGGSIPVEGVSFTIDGVTAVNGKGTILQSDKKGAFSILVPVGIHEVKAKKNNHIFEHEGRILNLDGTDRNYQDRISGLELYDITTVDYVGRVAGGKIQEEYPLGHGLSANNLADSIKVVLTYENEAYQIAKTPYGTFEKHFKPSNKAIADSNYVSYQGNEIIVDVHPITGEFRASVIPESFKVKVNVPYYGDMIAGNGSVLNLTNAFIKETELYEYTDSTLVNGNWVYKNYSDTTSFNKGQKFIARVKPEIRIVQLDRSGKELSYFGEQKTFGIEQNGDKTALNLINDQKSGMSKYVFGMPFFAQNTNYSLRATIFEGYTYRDQTGNPKEEIAQDRVPSQDALIRFKATMHQNDPVEVKANENGEAEYTFTCSKIELTSATASLTATASVGDPATATWFDWNGETNKVVVLGSESTGSNFVTAGPDKLLTVLRDPPGTNSYAFLEKGASFKETSAYTGNVTNTGSESLTQKLGTELVTFTGIGVGTIQSATTSTGFTVGVNHEESVGGTNAKESVTTTTTRFQTSDDPLYVGALGDVYVGYSTNIVFGEANSINFISRNKLESVGSENIESVYPAIYEDITPHNDSEWILVQQKTLSIGQEFATLFAYPQVHIENILIPNLEKVRNQIFRFSTEKSASEFQAEADLKGKPIVVSYLTMDDENFGLSNTDKAFKQDSNKDDLFDGPSYRIFFPDAQEIRKDTIEYMNQSILAWVDQMAANEKAKKEAKLIQNYSFHAGSPVEYSESYSNTTTKSQTFNLSLGFNFKNDTDVNLFGTGFSLSIDETVTTEHGGEFSTEDEKSHSKGFVFAEDGDDDYLSVDVCYEVGRDSDGNEIENNQYSSFIFRTKGGVTSCPYEGEYVTKYFEEGQHELNAATMQIEVPNISVENDFIENVPSGKPAYLTVYLRNNSEVQQEVWYDLKVDDTSNPNGARFSMDGGAIGNGRAVMLPAGTTLVKTVEVTKGSVMNYDDLKLILISQCQGDPTTFLNVISDTVSFSVQFTPSCTDVNIAKPGNNWTYNTKLPTISEDGIKKHFMEVVMDGFDVNYDNFNRIMLQYKPASASDDQWTTVMNYYNDSTLYKNAINRKENAEMILSSNGGKIKHNWMIDNLPDQRYDLRAVSICIINNEEVESISEARSGIKDMYMPRLFGSAQPANGILTINDEIRLNFNEQIADGYLTRNNFQVSGVRNGSKTDHSVSLTLDGINDALKSAHVRNWENKDITVEMWVRTEHEQDAVFFSQGNNNKPLELGITSDNRLKVRIGNKEFVSEEKVPFEKGTWAHVALTVSKEGFVTAYYNSLPYLTEVRTNQSLGEGKWMFGGSLFTAGKNFNGQMHNARIWNKVLTSGRLQTNNLTILSGAESGLLAYYPMNEAKGLVVNDKAQGMNLTVDGAEWTLPAGYGVSFNGKDQYLTVSTGSSAVIDGSMDATIEFWFKGGAENANAALLTNGCGDGTDAGGSYNLFAIGFENSKLTFRNNGAAVEVEGDYLDNNWHHFALSINRNTGRSQVMIDGLLNTYFESADMGSIASDRMVLGARNWYNDKDITTPVVDRFFNGSMDELRIWNHYKNSTLIEKGAFEKLNGNEKGLLAYYPFETYIEWQGVQELKFSLADKKQQEDPTLQVPDAIVSSGNLETADKAPVRDCGPVENLQYSFVVNNDALIISMNEPWEKIEKTIVTFTVEGVLDINGNEIASPVTWSAYIDRNQLRWVNDEVEIVKDVNEAGSFTVDIKNHGGAVENYVIENMPYWLSVSPVSGSVNPASSQKITFVIDEALNIGNYNEVIYLRNDYNVMESLAINIKVNGEKPDWSVNPKEFKYNMNVFGKIRINSIFSNDEEDMLAAFINGKCVGVTTNLYHKASDMWYAYLTVYSNDPVNEQIEFRIWNASTGKVYLATSEEKIGFKNNDVVGTASTPIIFDTKDMVYQNIPLESGWNWISFQVNNGMLGDVNSTLSNNTWKPGDIVKSETNGFDSYSNRLGWVGMLTDNGGFDNTSMFMLKTSEDKVVSVSGAHVEMDQNPIVVLGKTASNVKRWSYIAYQPSVNQPLNEALSGYDAVEGDVIKSQDAFAMYGANLGWIGNLTFMEPGKGYMLQRNDQNDAMLKYAQTNSSRQMFTRSGINTQYTEGYKNRTYAGNMNVVATVEAGFELMDGDKIQAYVDGELRGESAVTADSESGDPLFFLNVAGEQTGTLNFSVVRDSKPVAQSVNTFTYVNHMVAGSVNEPIELRFREESVAGVYPNPFTSELNIIIEAAAGDRAEVIISDVIGNLMYRYAETVQYDGQIHLLWDQAESCLPGIYVVKITIGDTVRVYKVEKK